MLCASLAVLSCGLVSITMAVICALGIVLIVRQRLIFMSGLKI